MIKKITLTIVGFNISKGFQAKLASNSIKRFCEYTTEKRGKITLGKLVSAHTASSPRYFLDVFNFQIKTEKSAVPLYLHVGMYRDQNYFEIPFYISSEENYYDSMRKKYNKK